MGRLCKVDGCVAKQSRSAHGYNRMVSFPKDVGEYGRWVDAMPNHREDLMEARENNEEMWICASHFDCEYKSVRGGKRPMDPPSVFPNIPKSHFKQVVPIKRRTEMASSDQRQQRIQELKEQKDKITNFDTFVKCVGKRLDKKYLTIRNEDDFTIFQTDELGTKVVKFLHFRQVLSTFGFLKLVDVQKNGFDVPKVLLDIQKNHYIHKWSKLKFILYQ